jgi:hypothetical protein
MPDNPAYTLMSIGGTQGFNFVHGTEYEVAVVPNRNGHNAACAVCYVATRHTTIMIPATTTCPAGWTMEYMGYLMSEARLHFRTMYECVDMNMDVVPGTAADVTGSHFYHVEADCSGVACPPYDNQRELNCVVCSR